ncbi:MAG: MFS family permease [Chloroflexi bacterium]|nr:MAG: MFS family permease [Chloroflexota bacterium]
MPWLRETFASFAVRHYRYLWVGSMFATTAFMMSFMLLPSVAYEITGNNASAGIAQMGSGIGMFLVGPFGGVIADRRRKKPLVLAGQAIPGIVILTIGILILSGSISILLLTVTTMFMGVGFAFMGPARQAWVGELMPDRLLPNAVALQQIALTMAQVLGPLFVAILVGPSLGIGVGAGWAYLFMAGLFVIVLPMTSLLPNTDPAPKLQRRSIQQDLVEGIRYVWGDARLRLLWTSFVAVIVCGFSFQTLLPGLLDQEFGRDPKDVGVIFLSFAIAGLAMNVAVAGVVRKPIAWPLMLLMGLLMMSGFVLLAAAPSYWVLLLAAVPLGAGRSGYWLINNALLMANAKKEFYGRVMSLASLAFGSQALLAPVWGVMADSIGIRETLFIVSALGSSAVALAALNWLRIRNVPVAAGVPAAVPAAADAPT